MTCLTRHVVASLLAISITGPVLAEPWESDIVGYTTYMVPAGSSRMLALNFVPSLTVMGTVTQVDSDHIHASGWATQDPLGSADSAVARIRTGPFSGLTIPVTAIEGNRVDLGLPFDGMISVGDVFSVYPNWTLGELLGPSSESGLMEGDNPATADTISIWNLHTQSTDVFYYRTGEGLRKAGHQQEGDQSGTMVPPLTGLIVTRRAPEDWEFVVAGLVPMPIEQGFLWLYPGRNVVSAPFNNAKRISVLLPVLPPSPYAITPGLSAAEADTLRVTDDHGNESPILYYRTGEGWRAVGIDGDAGDTPVDFVTCLDYHRAGPDGFIKLVGVAPDSAPAPLLAGTPPRVVPIDRVQRQPNGIEVHWEADKAGVGFQLQRRQAGQVVWQDLGERVVSTSTLCSQTWQPSGAGQLRVIISE